MDRKEERASIHQGFHQKLESFEPTLAGVSMKLDPLADYPQQSELQQESWSRFSSPSSVLHNHLPRVAAPSTLSPSPVTSESSTTLPDHQRHAYTPFFQHPSTYPPMRLAPLGLGAPRHNAPPSSFTPNHQAEYPSYPFSSSQGLPVSRPHTASTSSAGSTSGSGGSSPRLRELAMGAAPALPTWYGQQHPGYDWHPQQHQHQHHQHQQSQQHSHHQMQYPLHPQHHLRPPSRSPSASPHPHHPTHAHLNANNGHPPYVASSAARSTSSAGPNTDTQGGKKPSARSNVARRASASVAPYEGVMGVSGPNVHSSLGTYTTSPSPHSHMGGLPPMGMSMGGGGGGMGMGGMSMGMSTGLGLGMGMGGGSMAGMGMGGGAGMMDHPMGRKKDEQGHARYSQPGQQVGPQGGGGGEQILGMGLEDVDESMLDFTSRQDTKPTRLLRRQCFNCRTWRDVSAWRRSIIQPGHIVCNKCGLYEKAHKRARPLNERGEFVRPGKSASTHSHSHQHVIHAHPPLSALPSLNLSGASTSATTVTNTASAAGKSPAKKAKRGSSATVPPPRRDSQILAGEEKKKGEGGREEDEEGERGRGRR